MPAQDVDWLESTRPGFIEKRLAYNSSRINARCRKRYAAPFAVPAPELVVGWLVDLTTLDAYQARGWNPSDEQSALVKAAADRAEAETKEAADGEAGLFDLPLREDTTADGISRGGPLVYAEASPYDWVDVQAEAIRGR